MAEKSRPRIVVLHNPSVSDTVHVFGVTDTVSRTAIRFKDIDGLVDELLDDPNFEELQYMAMRINRRWLEAAKTAYRA